MYRQLILAATFLTLAFSLSGGAAADNCASYGVNQQISVTGDNTYTCQVNECTDAAGAASAGASVGTSAGEAGDGASASAGTGSCSNESTTPTKHGVDEFPLR